MDEWVNAFEPEKREEECIYKPEEAVTVHAFYTCVNHDLHMIYTHLHVCKSNHPIFHLSTQNMVSKHQGWYRAMVMEDLRHPGADILVKE